MPGALCIVTEGMNGPKCKPQYVGKLERPLGKPQKMLGSDVAAQWSTGKPQWQPDQCGQLQPENETVQSHK